MNHTDNYGLRKPENNEYISIDDLNYNTDKIDAVLQEKVNSYDGDISNTIIGALEESKEEFPVPAVKEKTRVFFGKVRKFIQDFNDFKTGILTVGMIINNAVTDNSNLPVSAAVAKALQDQLTQLNSDLTVENITSKITAREGTNIVQMAGRRVGSICIVSFGITFSGSTLSNVPVFSLDSTIAPAAPFEGVASGVGTGVAHTIAAEPNVIRFTATPVNLTYDGSQLKGQITWFIN